MAASNSKVFQGEISYLLAGHAQAIHGR